ncbi:response regulator [uncultured Aureimonas sp.]|uniref:response regulator n=1 Tax=uncultured Aureimonas sp. TaxID=1604662 RepID=UPI0025F965A6|nr:response regulator [uncultured Aureimonas sp.]
MLQNKQILLVEDDFLIARPLAEKLEDAGATVVGPTATIEESIALIARVPDIDAALMDVNLAGEMSYPVAYDLVRRGVPFVFLTAYDPSLVAARFRDVPVFAKPVEFERVMEALQALTDRQAQAN